MKEICCSKSENVRKCINSRFEFDDWRDSEIEQREEEGRCFGEMDLMFIKLNEEKIDSCLYSVQSSSCTVDSHVIYALNEISRSLKLDLIFIFMKHFVVIISRVVSRLGLVIIRVKSSKLCD